MNDNKEHNELLFLTHALLLLLLTLSLRQYHNQPLLLLLLLIRAIIVGRSKHFPSFFINLTSLPLPVLSITSLRVYNVYSCLVSCNTPRSNLATVSFGFDRLRRRRRRRRRYWMMLTFCFNLQHGDDDGGRSRTWPVLDHDHCPFS